MNIVITGGSGGLGKAIIKELHNWALFNEVVLVHDWSRETGVDVRDFNSIMAAYYKLPEKIDVLINCAGINRIAWMKDISEATWDEVMDTNAKGIWLVSSVLLDKMEGGTILNIVSNAAQIPMTHSIVYNASKAAALMMTKQMARELGKTHDITVLSVSPNKLHGTGMSKEIEARVRKLRNWTEEEANTYQLAALPAGAETPPEVLAEFIAFLLSSKERHRYLQGCDITYGGPTP